MRLTLSNILFSENKGKRNTIFILLLIFGFPAIALINYSLEIQTGIISKAFRLINLLISFLLIFEFVFNSRFKTIFNIKYNKAFLKSKIPFILFLFFWGLYLFRMIIDLEVYHINTMFSYSKSYYYLFTIGITIIPMIAVATIHEIDVDFLQLSLHRYLVVLNCLLLLIFILGKIFNPIPDYRFFVMRNEFYYLDAITIAVYGSLLILTSFFRKDKRLINYLWITLGFFIVLTTASRGPILSILLALLFILIFKDKKFSIKYLHLTVALTISTIANYATSIFFAKEYIVGNPLIYRLSNITEDTSTISRVKILKDGFQQFLEGPFFGTHFLVIESNMYAHNLLLDVLLATGILGLLFLIPIFMIFVRNILSKTHQVFLSVIGFYLFLNTLTSGACYNMTEFWIIFVLVVLHNYNESIIQSKFN